MRSAHFYYCQKRQRSRNTRLKPLSNHPTPSYPGTRRPLDRTNLKSISISAWLHRDVSQDLDCLLRQSFQSTSMRRPKSPISTTFVSREVVTGGSQNLASPKSRVLLIAAISACSCTSLLESLQGLHHAVLQPIPCL
jgi:hypothetical protein